jgi:hypothetical protein
MPRSAGIFLSTRGYFNDAFGFAAPTPTCARLTVDNGFHFRKALLNNVANKNYC